MKEDGGMSQFSDLASKREFFLYWAGFVIVVVSSVSVLLSLSGVLTDVLSYRCWYPILSPLLGMSEPLQPTQAPNMQLYCGNPAVSVVRFIFNFLSGLIFAGAGGYMMLNGKKR
jgi:hypothetical protein